MRCAIVPPGAELVPQPTVSGPLDTFVLTSSHSVAGVLSQLALITYHAHTTFRTILEETAATSDRIFELQARYDHLQQGVSKKNYPQNDSIEGMKSLPRTRLELQDQEKDELLSPETIPASLEYTCSRYLVFLLC